ncbi:hypothetical protein NMG60_11012812 [Bertholletia excelsa]
MREVVVEVGGDRILRSTGRKDRHSKVCTSRGLRDRRVRLSPNTAIQFYDVQDRLGFERPSEAIDWLMNKAKASIEALDSYPPAAKPEQDLEEQSHEDPSLLIPLSSADFRSLLRDPDFRSRSQIEGFSFSGEAGMSSSPAVHFEATPTSWSNLQTLQISGNGGGRGGIVANPEPQWQETVFLGQNQLFSSQGGTLQSSYPPPSFPAAVDDLNSDQFPPIGASWDNIDRFAGAQASPRIKGEGEKQNPVPSKQSSATYLLHYPY